MVGIWLTDLRGPVPPWPPGSGITGLGLEEDGYLVATHCCPDHVVARASSSIRFRDSTVVRRSR